MMKCDGCNGSGFYDTLVAYMDGEPKTYRHKCRGCKGTGEIKEREFTVPESVSWCISDTSWRIYQIEGLIITKAHRHSGERHEPVCASRVWHPKTGCVSVPVSWPMCRKCARKMGIIVPQIFEDAFA